MRPSSRRSVGQVARTRPAARPTAGRADVGARRRVPGHPRGHVRAGHGNGHAFPGVSSASDAYQQPDGNVTVYLGTSHSYDPAPGYYAEVRPSGELVRRWAAPSGFYTDPHEFRVGAGPGGSTYLLGYDYTRMDLQTRGGSADSSVAEHTIFQVDASGGATPVFVARDHFSVADWVDPEPGLGDFDHPNSIDVDRDGGLVVSWRNIDEVSKIDPRTTQFVWRLGGPHNQFTFVNDPLAGFGGQHFARLLADGDLLLYDDGTTHVPQQTRVVEYRLDLTAHLPEEAGQPPRLRLVSQPRDRLLLDLPHALARDA